MNNRLTLQDLAGLLAEHTGKERSDCEIFLKEFVALVTEGVFLDKLVKIKGLGTFKLIPVEQRESIHVNTGERFLIPAHSKLSFIPDKELREQVNKPFSFFETTEISDPDQFTDIEVSDDPEDEIDAEEDSAEEVLSERSLISVAEEDPEPEKIDSEEEVELSELPVIETEVNLEPESDLQPVVAEEVSEEIGDLPAEIYSAPESALAVEKVSSEPDPVFLEKKKSAKRHWVSIAVIFVSLMIIGNIHLYQNRMLYFAEKPKNVALSKKRVSLQASEDRPEVLSDTVRVDTMAQSTLPEVKEVKPSAAETAPVEPVSLVLDRVTIERGSRLTLLSLKYYGSKLFWVYIYEHNKAKIKDPNNVPVGTVVEIPAPHLYGIDARNKQALKRAAELQTEILSATY